MTQPISDSNPASAPVPGSRAGLYPPRAYAALENIGKIIFALRLRGDPIAAKRKPGLNANRRWNGIYPLTLTLTNKHTGESASCDLKSVRDAAKRIGVVLKFYRP